MAATSTPMNIEPEDKKYDYDLVVIGGGSGGLAAAKEAKKINPALKVAVFDYVHPTPHGTKWKIGGTCVNVGCIPKKLFHHAGAFRETMHDAHNLGWAVDSKSVPHSWENMVQSVTEYVKSLSHAHGNALANAKIPYIAAYASFTDPHTVQYELKGAKKTLSAARFVVAVGGRPHYPNIPGAELAITSDDIFWRKRAPGKTLVVGGGYIALECASFLQELGYDTTVLVRSVLLRGFDQQCAEQIGEILERRGVRFIRPAVPLSLAKNADGTIKVTFETTNDQKQHAETYDTVLLAIGRDPQVKLLGLDKAGVALDSSGKINVNDVEQTSASHIFAIGDATIGPAGSAARPELTPVAIQTGVRLARRLYANATQRMNWHLIPTTVFTDPEYGTVGYSQEAAEAAFGKENIAVYVSRFNALENATGHAILEDFVPPRTNVFTGENLWIRKQTLAKGQPWEDFDPADPLQRADYENFNRSYGLNKCLAKLVCDKKHGDRVIGFHYVGPNAGEITQGFTLALRYGATKQGFDDLIGIHPTSAEEFAVLATVFEPGVDFVKKEGCGGGGSC